jgi:hypothetical protein
MRPPTIAVGIKELDMRLVNVELLKSPYNWAAVTLIVVFGLSLLALLYPQSGE